MKNLKIKFGLFSLLAILAVSVFLTSCEQSNTILGEQLEDVESIEQVTPESEFEGLLLPSNIVDMGEAATKTYLEGLSNEELEQHVNDYVIMDFLTNEGLQDVAVDHYTKNESLKNINLSDYMSDDKVAALNNNLWVPSQVSARCCYTITQWLCKVTGGTMRCTKYRITFCS